MQNDELKTKLQDVIDDTRSKLADIRNVTKKPHSKLAKILEAFGEAGNEWDRARKVLLDELYYNKRWLPALKAVDKDIKWPGRERGSGHHLPMKANN